MAKAATKNKTTKNTNLIRSFESYKKKYFPKRAAEEERMRSRPPTWKKSKWHPSG